MNMYPLTEINGKLDEFKKDLDWVIDHIQQTRDSVTWLVGFAKKVEPRLDRLELYAELLPSSRATIEELKEKIARLEYRQRNTAILHGAIIFINEKANPPIVKIQNRRGDEFEVHIPPSLFNSADLSTGIVIRIEGKPKNHTIPGRGRFTVFHATGIEKINPGSVDKDIEVGYNDN